MIVGKDVAKVSASAEGCTFENKAYKATIGNTTFTIYDTTGLNEGDRGRVPHCKAVRGLYKVIRQLNGVSLLVCCMRGRAWENIRFNWILFNKVICGEKVPIVAVVTGLETYGNPDDWKSEGMSVLQKNGMTPKAVGCVVSYQEKRDVYAQSQVKVRNLIIKHYLREPWSEEKDEWFASSYHDVPITRFCFPSRRLDYSTEMRNRLSELITVSKMEKEDTKKLEAALLTAEKQFRKR